MARDPYHRPSFRKGLFLLIRRVWEFAWKAGLTLLVPLLLVIAWYAYQACQFDLKQVEVMPARTVLIDRNGDELGTIHGASRRLISAEEIPDFLKECLFAREDSRFLRHQGVDYLGLARASLRNLKDFDFTQGASTLSMQLARNTYDLREKKSLNRKFLEIALTYRIESKYPKAEILTHYLNRIYFGSGFNGIEEAALNYFGSTTSELSKGQMALLVGIIRAPHACSPWRNLKGATRQRNEVLNRLVATEVLTEAEAQKIRATPLKLQNPDQRNLESTHACRAIRRPLEELLDRQQVSTGGLQVITTIDASTQHDLEKLVSKTKLPEGCQMAALALHPSSGGILGIVGCHHGQPTGFNRALDSYRDLGSDMIEPFITTIALERSHLPIAGKPVSTGRQLNPDDARQLLRRFGFRGSFGQKDDLYRGTLSTSLIELACAYATIFNNGKRPEPAFLSGLFADSKSIFRRRPEITTVFSEHAQLKNIPSLLSGKSLPRTDFWAASLSAQKIIVLWVGYDRPKRFTLDSSVSQQILAGLEKAQTN